MYYRRVVKPWKRKFAWLPFDLPNGPVIWWEHYEVQYTIVSETWAGAKWKVIYRWDGREYTDG